ncbi:MAG: DUF1330 domain-containing protein [Acidimicrobiales bacterium]
MSAYIVANYNITNPEGFESYGPAVMPVLTAHGAQVLVSDRHTDVREGSPGHVTVVVRFESKEAARTFYESAEYQAIMHHRTDNAEGFLVICDGLDASS